jgi:outer membrane receptor protein involved in Fe transport
MRLSSKYLIVILILIHTNIYGEDSSKIKVNIGIFQSFKDSPEDRMNATKFREILARKLNEAGYVATILDVEHNAGLSVDADFYIDGFYKANPKWSVYGQIYRPDNKALIDAHNQINILSDLEGVSVNLPEAESSNQQIWEEFSKKIIIRLKTNKNRVKKIHNIQEFVLDSKVKDFVDVSIAQEERNKAKSDVFQILAEQNITVASNVIREADKQPVSVTVINSKQIQLSGARTVNDLLMIYVPGYFKVEDQDDSIAGFRGLAPDSNAKVLLLVNGINMNTEWQFGPPDSIINSINLDYIDRIEVIRGPGSVTLGQGALLGVINIITKNSQTQQGTSLQAGYGKDGFRSLNIQSGAEGKLIPELKTYFYFSKMQYNGQALRSDGWTKQRAYEGVEINGMEQIFDPREKQALKTTPFLSGDFYPNIASASGNRLDRNENEMMHGNIEYKGFKINTMLANQNRDLYNFYRDRNQVESKIRNGGISYTHEFSEKLKLNTKGFYTQDDFGFQSHRGVNLAGTRENRYGGASILNWSISSRNNLAIGLEYRKYDLGRQDENGNNFIVNKAEAASFFKLGENIPSPYQVNDTNKFVFSNTIAVASFFMEDSHKLSEKWDLFAAFRYDKHPYWGSNISPRVGTIFSPNKDLKFRLSYQEGFRGAVGVSYTGGYQRDGLLRNDNFNQVEQARVPTLDENKNPAIFRNVPEAKPEKMRSIEFATKYRFTSKLSIDGVLFYNMIQNVIDVGVIYPTPDKNPAPRIGTDEPGDWKGYFFFRNTPGLLRQGGAEISTVYNHRFFQVSLSHSAVKVLGASTELHSSQYLTSDTNHKHFRAYPENVSRANFQLYPHERVAIGLNYLYYYQWFAPTGANVRGMHMLNGGFQYSFSETVSVILSIKNILDARNLYPINSIAGDVSLAAGSPSYEGRTYWLQARAVF